jgi:hypothetical protein
MWHSPKGHCGYHTFEIQILAMWEHQSKGLDVTPNHILISYYLLNLNIIRLIKSRRIRWAGHVALTGEVHTGFW